MITINIHIQSCPCLYLFALNILLAYMYMSFFPFALLYAHNPLLYTYVYTLLFLLVCPFDWAAHLALPFILHHLRHSSGTSADSNWRRFCSVAHSCHTSLQFRTGVVAMLFATVTKATVTFISWFCSQIELPVWLSSTPGSASILHFLTCCSPNFICLLTRTDGDLIL